MLFVNIQEIDCREGTVIVEKSEKRKAEGVCQVD